MSKVITCLFISAILTGAVVLTGDLESGEPSTLEYSSSSPSEPSNYNIKNVKQIIRHI